MGARVEFERCMIGVRIFRVVVGKFSYWKEPSPINLLVVNKNPEICLYCIVLPLGLTINFGVKSSGEPLFDSEEVT